MNTYSRETVIRQIVLPAFIGVFVTLHNLQVITAFAAVSTFVDGIVIGDTTLSGSLLLDVNGAIGATLLCDEAGANCIDPATIAGGVGGTGTAGYVAKFTASSTLADSVIQDNGTNVGISRTPSEKLDVNGNIVDRGGNIYFQGLSQKMYGGGDDRFYFDMNDALDGYITMRNSSQTALGSIYGLTDGVSTYAFGLLDADGNWAIRHRNDESTQWRINDIQQMILTTTGLHIGTSTTATTTLDVGGDAYIGGNMTFLDDADISGIDQIIGYNDLRFYGDSTGGPDLYIGDDGKIGIGGTGFSTGLNILNCSEADLTDDAGCIMLGDKDSTNIAIDTNEIQGRNNGSNSSVFMQPEGGNVYFNASDNFDSLFIRGDSQSFEIRPGYYGDIPATSYTTLEMTGTETLYVWDNLEMSNELILRGGNVVMTTNTVFEFANGEIAWGANENGSVPFYYNNSNRFQTMSYGMWVLPSTAQVRVSEICDYDASHCVPVDYLVNRY